MAFSVQELSGNACIVDADANVIEANRHYVDLVGRPEASIIGHNISEWVQPCDWPDCRRSLDHAAATGAAAEFLSTVQRPDGSVTIIVGQVLPLRSSAAYIVSCNRIIYASTGTGACRKAEVAEYVVSLAGELARAADRAGLATLGSRLRDLTGHADQALRDLDDEP